MIATAFQGVPSIPEPPRHAEPRRAPFRASGVARNLSLGGRERRGSILRFRDGQMVQRSANWISSNDLAVRVRARSEYRLLLVRESIVQSCSQHVEIDVGILLFFPTPHVLVGIGHRGGTLC